MENEQRKALAKELTALIQHGNAHVTFEDAIANLKPEHRGITPDGLPYSIWQLVEHMRIAQADIIEFCVSENYQEKDWPKDYWTEAVENVTDEQWNEALEAIRADQETFTAMLEDPEKDLYKPFSWGNGQNLLREAILIGDHNAYHTAEIVVIRRLLKDWK